MPTARPPESFGFWPVSGGRGGLVPPSGSLPPSPSSRATLLLERPSGTRTRRPSTPQRVRGPGRREGRCDRPFITKGMGGLPTSTTRAAVKAVRGWDCCPPTGPRGPAGQQVGFVPTPSVGCPSLTHPPHPVRLPRVGWPGLARGTRTLGGRRPDRRECGEAAIGPSRGGRGPRLGWWRKTRPLMPWKGFGKQEGRRGSRRAAGSRKVGEVVG